MPAHTVAVSATSRRDVLRGGALGMGALAALGVTSGEAVAAPTVQVSGAPTVQVSGAATGSQVFLLQVPGVTGTSTIKGFVNQIPVLSFSWDVQLTASNPTGGGTVGKLVASPLAISCLTSRASAQLVALCVTGRQLRQVVLHGLRPTAAGGTLTEYFTLTLASAAVSDYRQGESSGELPIEQLSFVYSSATYTVAGNSATFTPTLAG